MADVFFSYSRADAERVQRLAAAMTAQGLSVWWDRSIPPGSTFDDVIERELDNARCVVVLWSRTSITSSWVKEEAEEGLRRGLLTPALIDDVRPPLGFRRVQAADLTDWVDGPAHPGFQALLTAVRDLLDELPVVSGEPGTSEVAAPVDAEPAIPDPATDGGATPSPARPAIADASDGSTRPVAQASLTARSRLTPSG